jgi:hypothetical protein
MAAGSADQPAPERAQERYGPLAVARMRKDDGRSLILYRRDDGADQDGYTPEAAPGVATAGDGEPT